MKLLWAQWDSGWVCGISNPWSCDWLYPNQSFTFTHIQWNERVKGKAADLKTQRFGKEINSVTLETGEHTWQTKKKVTVIWVALWWFQEEEYRYLSHLFNISSQCISSAGKTATPTSAIAIKQCYDDCIPKLNTNMSLTGRNGCINQWNI